MLTVSLITLIFYFHPSTTSATLFFRTLPILPEAPARGGGPRRLQRTGEEGRAIFRLDNSKQQAALETARRKIAKWRPPQVAAQEIFSRRKLPGSEGAYQQASDELDVKRDLQKRNPGIVRSVYRKLEVAHGRQAGRFATASSNRRSSVCRRCCR
jgi:multidrug resistance efflux pump